MTPNEIIDLVTPKADKKLRPLRRTLPPPAAINLTANTPSPVSACCIADDDNDYYGGNAHHDSDRPPSLPRLPGTDRAYLLASDTHSSPRRKILQPFLDPRVAPSHLSPRRKISQPFLDPRDAPSLSLTSAAATKKGKKTLSSTSDDGDRSSKIPRVEAPNCHRSSSRRWPTLIFVTISQTLSRQGLVFEEPIIFEVLRKANYNEQSALNRLLDLTTSTLALTSSDDNPPTLSPPLDTFASSESSPNPSPPPSRHEEDPVWDVNTAKDPPEWDFKDVNYKEWDELDNIAIQVNGDDGDHDESRYVDEVDKDVRTMCQFTSSVRRRNELLTSPDSPQWISTVKIDTHVLRCQAAAVAERRRLSKD